MRRRPRPCRPPQRQSCGMPKAAGSLRPCAPRFVRPARQSLLSACPAPCLFPHLRLWPPHLARPLHRAVRAPIPVVSTPAGKPLLCPPLLGGRVRSFGPFRASGRNARGTTGSARKPRPTHKEHGRLLRRRNRARRRPQPLPVAETRHAPVTACRHRIESERLRGGSRPSRPLPAPTIVADRKTSSIFKKCSPHALRRSISRATSPPPDEGGRCRPHHPGASNAGRCWKVR